MPCMGPSKDEELPKAIVAALREENEVIDWHSFHCAYFERVVAIALGLEWAKRSNNLRTVRWLGASGSMSEEDREQFNAHFSRIREVSCMLYGMLYGKSLQELDWKQFEHDLGEVIWARDACDF